MKILVAMSGGVDSSVAALLLKNQGHDIAGCTLLLSEDDCQGADEICAYLHIPHMVIDCRRQFKDQVKAYFLSEYQQGRTPNPCVVCNEKMKFQAILDTAKEHGYDKIATGHYASVEERDGKLYLAKTKAGKKDQSYFLYRLTNEQLTKIEFPLSEYTKDEIRKIAMENHLPAASKSDSQDVCFICGDYRDFLHENGVYGKPGDMVYHGDVIARHMGLPHYTIGQRKLGIAWESPLYVKEIDATNNRLIVCDNEELFSDQCYLSDVRLTHPTEASISCYIKPRSAAPAEKGTVRFLDNHQATVTFENAIRALTPGQSAVFYSEDGLVLGGGIIL